MMRLVEWKLKEKVKGPEAMKKKEMARVAEDEVGRQVCQEVKRVDGKKG